MSDKDCDDKVTQFTDITIVLDRSGSMESIRKAVVENINNFIKSVEEVPGDGCWTLVQFDDPDSARGAKEEFPQFVFEQKLGKGLQFTEEEFATRGGTALVDAMVIIINRIKERFLASAQRPRIMVVVMTDGYENASKIYKRSDLFALTSEMENEYGWKFIYLGANQDAFKEASSYGMKMSYNYSADEKGVSDVLKMSSDYTRSWKAEGNKTAEVFLSSIEKESSC